MRNLAKFIYLIVTFLIASSYGCFFRFTKDKNSSDKCNSFDIFKNFTEINFSVPKFQKICIKEENLIDNIKKYPEFRFEECCLKKAYRDSCLEILKPLCDNHFKLEKCNLFDEDAFNKCIELKKKNIFSKNLGHGNK